MRNQRGFSLIEVLVASTILLVVAVGILPLFASSIKSNQSGNDSTQVANFARERLERFIELPFNSTDMTIDAGSEKTFTEYFSLADRIWVAGAAPADDPALWTRTTVVRQYPVEALEDGQLDPASEALAAGYRAAGRRGGRQRGALQPGDTRRRGGRRSRDPCRAAGFVQVALHLAKVPAQLRRVRHVVAPIARGGIRPAGRVQLERRDGGGARGGHPHPGRAPEDGRQHRRVRRPEPVQRLAELAGRQRLEVDLPQRAREHDEQAPGDPLPPVAGVRVVQPEQPARERCEGRRGLHRVVRLRCNADVRQRHVSGTAEQQRVVRWQGPAAAFGQRVRGGERQPDGLGRCERHAGRDEVGKADSGHTRNAPLKRDPFQFG